MAPVTTKKHKFASLFSRQRPSPASQTPSFPFLKLPYDVRVIVYSKVDTEAPLSPWNDCFGFYQSCRQTKEELDEIVGKKIQGLCTTIKKTPNINLGIKIDPACPRHITVTLPYSAFEDESLAVRDPKWKREVLAALQPLLALHLKVLRIHISQQSCISTSIPKHDILRQKLELQDTMRDLLLDIGCVIDHQNYYWQHPHTSGYVEDLQRVFRDGPDLDFPRSIVHAQRICLSWDLRPNPSDSVALVGRSNDILSAEAVAPKRSFLGYKPKRHPFATMRSSRAILATGYYLRDSEHLVCEVGLSCPSRWCMDDAVASNGRLVTTESRKGRLVTSRGSGRELENGLVGMNKEELEETDVPVEKGRAEFREETLERLEDEMRWAYMREGITMD